MTPLISEADRKGRRGVHVGILCANVTPSSGPHPALLSHAEVETLFHEFGHLLHHCMSRVSVRYLTGTNVACDFMEFPSQMMENWCWQAEALRRFACHFESGPAGHDDARAARVG
jgi:oligopeptidase A